MSLAGVRGVAQHRIVDRDRTRFDLSDLIANLQHGVNESVELLFRLGLGRFDHQGASHREAHRRSMEPVVNEALRNVIDRYARIVGNRSDVDDAFMRNKSMGSRIRTG